MKKASRLTALLLALLLILQMTAVATEISVEDLYAAATPIPEVELNRDILTSLSSNVEAAAAVSDIQGFGLVNANNTALYYSFWDMKWLGQGTIVTVYKGTFELLFGLWGTYYKVSCEGRDGYILATRLNLCSCDVPEGAGLDAHADGCPDKLYYISVCNLSAEQIFANWVDYSSDIQKFILQYLSQNDSAKYELLAGMLNLGILEEILAAATLEQLKDIVSNYGKDVFRDYCSCLDSVDREAFEAHLRVLYEEFIGRILSMETLEAFEALFAFMTDEDIADYLTMLTDEEYLQHVEKYLSLGGQIALIPPICDCAYNTSEANGHESHCSVFRFYNRVTMMPAAVIASSWSNFSEDAQKHILSIIEYSDNEKLIELKLLLGLYVQRDVVTEDGLKASFIGNIPENVEISIQAIEILAVEMSYKVLFNLDITPTYPDGSKWQPDEGETVIVRLDVSTIPISEDAEAIAEEDVINILHTLDDGIQEDLGASMVTEGILTFETGSFSVFTGVEASPYYWENEKYIFLDLAKGNITIKDGSVSIGGFASISNSGNSKEYYIFQSNDQYTASYDADELTLPAYKIGGWSGTIDGNENVRSVVSAWNTYASSAGMTATQNRIMISGNGSYKVTIHNVWSDFHQRGQDWGINRSGFAYVPSGGSLTLNLEGDNRFGAVHYMGSSRFTIKSNSGTGTLTAAAHKDGDNFWAAAIGADDSSNHSENIVISGGHIFAGTTAADNCTALGGGGNGYGGVTIEGGTVTAIASTSGSAIGGGIGYHSYGGEAKVEIRGGTVHAVNHGIYLMDTKNGNKKYVITAAAIGGGSSIEANGAKSTQVSITGGKVYAKSVAGVAIGGGGSGTKTGGPATIEISGDAEVTALSVNGNVNSSDTSPDTSNAPTGSLEAIAGTSIGGGTGYAQGGNATVKIGGNPTVYTGSIGGGKCTGSGPIGWAQVDISGGTTHGQVVMASGSSGSCSFNMKGGVIDNTTRDAFTFIEENGGAVYVQDGTAVMAGGTIRDCPASNAVNGGAIYVVGGDFTMTGGTIEGANASSCGGAVYVDSGEATINGQSSLIQNCSAVDGGAIYVAGGTFSMTAGSLKGNTASGNGGAVYVSNTPVTFGSSDATKLEVSENSAANGGGFYFSETVSGIADSTISNGRIVKNIASSCGGGIYMTGSGGKLIVTGDGEINQNEAATGGGLYLIHGANLSVTGGSIYLNRAKGNGGNATTAYHADFVSGVGGGVAVASGAEATQSEFDLHGDNVGIYGNIAEFGADDVFASGNRTRLKLPKTADMNLGGSGEYEETEGWFEDYPKGDEKYTLGLNGNSSLGGLRYRGSTNTTEANVDKINSENGVYVCVTLGVYKRGKGSLTIRKITVDEEGSSIPSDHLFMFKVAGKPSAADETIEFVLAVPANGEEKVIDLLEGTYTVTELTGDEWRYETMCETVKTITIDSSNSVTRDHVVEFTNKRINDAWLDDVTAIKQNVHQLAD